MEFDAPQRTPTICQFLSGKAQLSASHKPYISYKLRCLETGKEGWVSCWDAEAAMAALGKEPSQFRGKRHLILHKNKAGYWSILAFGKG